MPNEQVKPNYYQLEGLPEVWEIEQQILALSPCLQSNPMVFKLYASAFEYLFRCGMKGDLKGDIKKCITNLQKILELLP